MQTVFHQSTLSNGGTATLSSSANSLQQSSQSLQQQQHLQQQNAMVTSSMDEPLNVGDVADLLHPQYAIITGGRSSDGCPILQFPDHNNFQTLSDQDYQKLILYLCSVPT